MKLAGDEKKRITTRHQKFKTLVIDHNDTFSIREEKWERKININTLARASNLKRKICATCGRINRSCPLSTTLETTMMMLYDNFNSLRFFSRQRRINIYQKDF